MSKTHTVSGEYGRPGRKTYLISLRHRVWSGPTRSISSSHRASHWTRRSSTPGPIGFNASSNPIDGANTNPFHCHHTRPCVSRLEYVPDVQGLWVKPSTSNPRHGVTFTYLRIRKDGGIASRGQSMGLDEGSNGLVKHWFTSQR